MAVGTSTADRPRPFDPVWPPRVQVFSPGVSACQHGAHGIYHQRDGQDVKVATRAGIPPFYVMEVMRAAEEREVAGGDVLHLEVGQPSTPAPKPVLAAAHRALDQNTLGYTTALGTPALRDRIAAHHLDWYGDDVGVDRVAVTAGASGACVLAFLASFDAGDRVAVVSPGYPCYRNMLAALAIEVVDIAVDASTRYQPTPELLQQYGDLAGLVVASPSNPTGTMLGAAEMQALCGWCDANDVRMISDEIYHGITYGPAAVSATNFSSSAIVVNSFSKYFSMTGWRLGWMIVPDDLHDAVERLAQNLFIAASSLSQHAAVHAFDAHDECQRNIERYAENRGILLDGLPRAGIDRLAPADGAFYIYAQVDHLSNDSQALCAGWLADLGVAATPGIDFDAARGLSTVRFSFAGSAADMTTAIDRLRAHINPA